MYWGSLWCRLGWLCVVVGGRSKYYRKTKYYDSILTPRSKYYIVFWPGVILPRGQNTIPHRRCSEKRLSGAKPKQRRADHAKYLHLICCDAWPIRYHYWTDDCINMITRMTMHYLKCNRLENDNMLLSHTCNTANWHAYKYNRAPLRQN